MSIETTRKHYEWSGMLWCEVVNASVGSFDKLKDRDKCPACNMDLDL